MEYIILGLLSIAPLTGYEIQKFIKNNFSMICSESYGSMHTALKNLEKKQYILFREEVTGGKKKKTYSITEKGREQFINWVETPMQAKKVKNMELSKLFFMGFASGQARVDSIKDYIRQMEEVKEKLLAIKAFHNCSQQEGQDKYHLFLLEYGLDAAEFEIQWYRKLLKKI